MVRQRSKDVHNRVLRAALELFAERGIDGTSMDAITQAAGVSKATVYNHWTNKEALLMDVMLMLNGLNRDPEDVDTGDLCADLTTILQRRPPDEFDAARQRMMPALIAYSAVHEEFGEAWRHRVMEPARQCLKRVLRRGIKRHQLPGTLDLDASMALLLGPMLYVHVFHRNQPLGCGDLGRIAAETFWRAHAMNPDGTKSSRKSTKARPSSEPA